MSSLKQKIMESAIRFFSEKGYMATSIQDIADDCGIAKGSLYRIFAAKEDLFIAVHDMRQQQLFERMEGIRTNVSLSAKEIFIRETEEQFSFLLDNRFLMQDIKEIKDQEGKIAPFLMHLRANLLRMNKLALIRRYGRQIAPKAWDLVLIYNGIVISYLFLLVIDNKTLNTRDISQFIVDRFEDVVNGFLASSQSGILTDEIMNEYIQLGCPAHGVRDLENIDKIFEAIGSDIEQLDTTHHFRMELREALDILRQEVEQDHPRPVLMQAMLNFMREERELRWSTDQLERHLKTMGFGKDQL